MRHAVDTAFAVDTPPTPHMDHIVSVVALQSQIDSISLELEHHHRAQMELLASIHELRRRKCVDCCAVQ